MDQEAIIILHQGVLGAGVWDIGACSPPQGRRLLQLLSPYVKMGECHQKARLRRFQDQGVKKLCSTSKGPL